MQKNDLVCLCHLRWAFTFQRPNHLMARCAQERRVFYVEEPVYADGARQMAVAQPLRNLYVCTPRLPPGATDSDARLLLKDFLRERGVRRPFLWLYSPMLLPLTQDLEHSGLVYDCMDELSLFMHAPMTLREREAELMARADLVFTGGQSLYEAKRRMHPRVFSFPSSVDVGHFSPSDRLRDPADQRALPRPRIGFFGVLDERLDLELIERLARERPDYQFVFVGPVVKIAESALPRFRNLHYLGPKRYEELPHYLSGWDVATMPFALNDATRFISPTKTLEYLAAGKPVVSTAVRDVVRPYGELGIVRIAAAGDFSSALDEALLPPPQERLELTERLLEQTSWEGTWSSMATLMRSLEQVSTTGESECSTI